MNRRPEPTGPLCSAPLSTAARAATAPEAWDNPDPLWPIDGFAKYLGVDEEFVRQLIKQGRLESVKIGGKVLVRKSVADNAIAYGTRPATQPLNSDHSTSNR